MNEGLFVIRQLNEELGQVQQEMRRARAEGDEIECIAALYEAVDLLAGIVRELAAQVKE